MCPLCSEIYQMTCHRPIGELSCGHIICYQCFVLNTNQFGCIQCEKPSEVFEKKDSLFNNNLKSTSIANVPTVVKKDIQQKFENQIMDVFHHVFRLSEVSIFD